MTIYPTKFLFALAALFALQASPVKAATQPPASGGFFSTQTYLGDAGDGYSVYYSKNFNTYTYSDTEPNYIYKFNFGFLYYFNTSTGDLSSEEAYFYDFTTDDYFYTSVSLYPYFYSFKLDSFLYYFEDSKPRQFYNFKTSSFVNY